MEREIIQIDENKCTGCGLCIPGCPEGAIQLIDGKARLVSDLFCDGLGACLGHCPEGAITIEKREAEPYDERIVIENIIKAGPNTIEAHLKHLEDHGETEFLRTAKEILKEKNIPIPDEKAHPVQTGGGCPGSQMMSFQEKGTENKVESAPVDSQLTHWPVQMHLISPRAPYYQNADVLLAADCTAYAVGNFHNRFLKNKSLAIACPKLDEGQDVYLAKLQALIDEANINTLTILIMQVPCCGGLIALAKKAMEQASRKVPVKKIVVSIQGDILSEEWL